MSMVLQGIQTVGKNSAVQAQQYFITIYQLIYILVGLNNKKNECSPLAHQPVFSLRLE